MSKNHWTCPEDFDADMLSISDFCDSTFYKQRETTSDHIRKTRSKPSICDNLPEELEETRPVRLGRGYPLVNRFENKRPGGLLSTQYQTTKEIREASGLSFSNDVIENSLKNDNQEFTESSITPNMPDIRLTSLPTSETSSISSTSKEGSPVQFRKSNELREAAVTNNQVNSASIYKVQESRDNHMPSLYDMVKSKPAENSKANEKLKERKKGNNNMNTLFTSNKNKSFNIASKSDFPDLS